MNKIISHPDQVKVLNVEKPAIEQLYNKFFAPSTNPSWRQDEDNFSLDQPSPLKFVPSETTYGIESLLCHNFNG